MLIDVNTQDYLARHDIVHHSPPTEGWEGLPLGNGSFGGPLWASQDGLIFQANHTDTYELPDPADPGEQRADWMVLRSCGRLTIQHAAPIHDWLYLNDFEARLSLGQAQATYKAHNAFGRFETTAFTHARRPLAVLHHRAMYAGDLAEGGAPIRITLERWGSRVAGWWYNRLQGGASFGLGKVQVSVDGEDACLQASFRGVEVALRCRVVGAAGSAPVQVRVTHARQVEITVEAAPQHDFTILLACATSHDSPDPLAETRAVLDAAQAAPDLAAEHRRWWADFWQRSFLHISQDYVENLYYLHHYLMGASARGKYPPLFNGGLWLWNHDVRNWVNPHHWNEQQSFWCLPAANRAEFIKPYMDTYHRLMPQAMASTERRGFQGMLWIDQHDFSGRQVAERSPSFRDNYTPAAQIGMLFWWHYLATGDVGYLRAKGYPFLNAVGDFYLGLLRWVEERGQYEVPLASTYEDERPWRFTDTITNLAMIRAVFPALIEASQLLEVDADKRARWQHVLDHLPPFRLNDRDKVRGVTLASGLVDGKELPEREDHGHGPLFCPIFPGSGLGLKDKGSPLFEAACHTLATYPPVTIAITPTVIIAARLGMAAEVRKRLTAMVRNLQHFSNGLFFNIDHWHTLSRRASPQGFAQWHAPGYWASRDYQLDDTPAYQRDYLEDRGCRFKNVLVLASEADGVAEHRADTPAAPFSQMGMESLGNLAAGLQEMLLQSHEGLIRVFPAIPDEWEGAFTLLAIGGFLVTSRRPAYGAPDFIEIVSQRGGTCRVALPWRGDVTIQQGEQAQQVAVDGDALTLDTVAGQRYLLYPGEREPNAHTYPTIRNDTPKTMLEARIGKPRDF